MNHQPLAWYDSSDSEGDAQKVEQDSGKDDKKSEGERCDKSAGEHPDDSEGDSAGRKKDIAEPLKIVQPIPQTNLDSDGCFLIPDDSEDEIELERQDNSCDEAANDAESDGSDADAVFEEEFHNAIDASAAIARTCCLLNDSASVDIDEWDVADEGRINFQAKYQ